MSYNQLWAIPPLYTERIRTWTVYDRVSLPGYSMLFFLAQGLANYGSKVGYVPFNDNLILVDSYRVCGQIHKFGDNLGGSSMF